MTREQIIELYGELLDSHKNGGLGLTHNQAVVAATLALATYLTMNGISYDTADIAVAITTHLGRGWR